MNQPDGAYGSTGSEASDVGPMSHYRSCLCCRRWLARWTVTNEALRAVEQARRAAVLAVEQAPPRAAAS